MLAQFNDNASLFQMHLMCWCKRSRGLNMQLMCWCRKNHGLNMVDVGTRGFIAQLVMRNGMLQLIDNVQWLIFVNVANGPASSTRRNDAQSDCHSPPLIENSLCHPPPLHMMSICMKILQWRGWSRKAAAIKLGRWWKPEGETLQGSEWVVGKGAHDGTAEEKMGLPRDCHEKTGG
jgi:hypothetical protein